MTVIKTEVQVISVATKFNDLTVRTYAIALDGGVEFARGSPHTHVVQADSDLSNESDEVKRWAGFHHTEEIKAALKKSRSAVF